MTAEGMIPLILASDEAQGEMEKETKKKNEEKKMEEKMKKEREKEKEGEKKEKKGTEDSLEFEHSNMSEDAAVIHFYVPPSKNTIERNNDCRSDGSSKTDKQNKQQQLSEEKKEKELKNEKKREEKILADALQSFSEKRKNTDIGDLTDPHMALSDLSCVILSMGARVRSHLNNPVNPVMGFIPSNNEKLEILREEELLFLVARDYCVIVDPRNGAIVSNHAVDSVSALSNLTGKRNQQLGVQAFLSNRGEEEYYS